MKPDREQLESDILAYIEGALPADAAARLEVYLDNSDPALKAQVLDMMEHRDTLRRMPALRAPRDLSEHIMQQVERTSLLGGVEQQLVLRPRRWWHTRVAIAAGFFIVVGGFTYLVVSSALPQHPQGPWGKWAERDGKKADERIAMARTAPNGMPAPGGPMAAHEDLQNGGNAGGGGDVGGAGGAAGPGDLALAKGGDSPRKGAAPTERENIRDAEVVAANLDRSRMLANGSIDAFQAQFRKAPNVQVALDNLRASPKQYSNGPAVVLTLAAKDSADVSRLKRAIEDLVVQDETVAKRQYELPSVRRDANGAMAEENRNTKDATGQAVASKSGLSETIQARSGPGADNSQQALHQTDAKSDLGARGVAMRQVVASPRAAQSEAKNQGSYKTEVPPGKGGKDKELDQAEKARALYDIAVVGSEAAPYRVYLRASQVDKLASDFQVVSIARGSDAYTIGAAAAREQVAGEKVNFDALKPDGMPLNLNVPPPTTLAAGTLTLNAATQPANNYNNYTGNVTINGGTLAGAGGVTTGANTLTNNGGNVYLDNGKLQNDYNSNFNTINSASNATQAAANTTANLTSNTGIVITGALSQSGGTLSVGGQVGNWTAQTPAPNMAPPAPAATSSILLPAPATPRPGDGRHGQPALEQQASSRLANEALDFDQSKPKQLPSQPTANDDQWLDVIVEMVSPPSTSADRPAASGERQVEQLQPARR